VVVAAACVPRLLALLWLGPIEAPDTATYRLLAGELLGRAPHGGAFPAVSYDPLYRGYAGLLAVLELLAGPARLPVVAMLVQGALSAAAAFVIFGLAQELGAAPRAATALAAGHALLPETVLWDRVLSSDSFNLSLLTFALAAVTRSLPRERSKAPRLWLPSLMVLLAITRVTNLVFLSLSACALLAAHAPTRSLARARGAAGLLLCAALFAVLLSRTRVYDTTPLAHFSRSLASGIVINDRPEYDIAPRSGPEPFERLLFAARVVAARALLFWSPLLAGYSARHAALNLMTLAPLFGVALLGLWRGARDPALRYTAVYFGALLAGYTALHAVTTLDFDLRYRLPTLPALFGLAAIAARPVPKPSAPQG
jgi:hypothetical protein